MEFRDKAQAYLQLGWAVFPVHSLVFETDMRTGEVIPRCTCGWDECPRPGKHPRIPKKLGGNGVLDATTNSDQIDAWSESYPDANLAVATGRPSGVIAVDIDGAEGENTISVLAANNYRLPQTVEARSGSGGRHLYYKWAPGIKTVASVIGPKVDLRGDGGQCVLPPSMHKSGNAYTWIRPPETTFMPPMPMWIIRRLKEVELAKQGLKYEEYAADRPKRLGRPAIERIMDRARIVAALSPECGHRNHTLNQQAFIAFRIADEGHIPDSEVEHHMLAAARACGLTPGEARPTILSARRSARSKPAMSR
ncbi:bifunctional DNA primase/polymerase [Hyphomicrobium sp.]|uniref:bifunctional DNA primase/polymerase n=1 Tax=Hyphomicrobium sp. TaxID=82 RepID=UPI001D892646|nr:bifunctional DNA primase/polymerase [Hyphomicrobium sp.]MBY0561467.1 bifunctional DNA primase/polymerase [Hyphomicrobium sp.]